MNKMSMRCKETRRTWNRLYLNKFTRERVQVWLNLIVVMSLQYPRMLSYSIILPSVHEFVTASRLTDSVENDTAYSTIHKCGVISPGLEQSEWFYSWVVTAFSLGAFIVSPLMGGLPRLITYRFSILLAFLVLLAGSILYANTVEAWMILVSRFLIGVFDGACPILLLSFASQTAANIEKHRQQTKSCHIQQASRKGHQLFSLKDKLFAVDLLNKGIVLPISLGISAILSQFDQIDQYRWPGWFLLILGVVYIIVILLIYRETEPCRKKQFPPESKKDTEVDTSDTDKVSKNKKWICSNKCQYSCLRFHKISWRTVIVTTYFIYCGYVSSSLFNVTDTLLSPVLSDLFGFNISDIAVFFLVLMFVTLGATIVLVILKCLRTDNRMVLVVTLCLGIVGLTLASDWQSIGEDPCKSTFITNLNANLSHVHDTYPVEVRCDNTNSTDSLSALCLAGSSEKHICVWNGESWITGQKCIHCRPLCRTETKCLNFVLFCIGIVLIVLCTHLFNTVTVAIITDVSPQGLQRVAISAVFTANSAARMLTPLWIDYVYEQFDRKTFPPLTMINITLVIALAGVVVLYKQLGHRGQKESSSWGVTNPLEAELEKSNGSQIDIVAAEFELTAETRSNFKEAPL